MITSHKYEQIKFDEDTEKLISKGSEIINYKANYKGKDFYFIEKLKYTPGFAKLYLYICRSIKDKTVMFGAKETSERTEIPLSTIYRLFKYLSSINEISKNMKSSVTAYVIAVPIEEFVTSIRLNTAVNTLRRKGN